MKRFSPEELQAWFGKWRLMLYEKVRGKGSAALTLEYTPKSVGEQETFDQDTLDLAFIFERLWHMCRHVRRRLKAEGFGSFRTVVLTVRFADFDTRSRAHTLARPRDSLRVLSFEARKIAGDIREIVTFSYSFLRGAVHPGSRIYLPPNG